MVSQLECVPDQQVLLLTSSTSATAMSSAQSTKNLHLGDTNLDHSQSTDSLETDQV